MLFVILSHAMLQVGTLDEASIAQKVQAHKSHEATMDVALENFDQANTRFKAMMDEA